MMIQGKRSTLTENVAMCARGMEMVDWVKVVIVRGTNDG